MGYPILPRRPKSRKRNRDPDKSRTSLMNINYRYSRVATYYTGIPPSGPFIWANEARDVNASGLTAVKTFTRNPDWKVKVVKHMDASSPYTHRDGAVTPCYYKGTALTVASNTRYTFNGSDMGPSLIDDSDDLIARDRALTKLKRKLADHVGNAAFGPPLAESRELHSLIKSICNLTEDALIAAINFRKTRGVSAYKFLSQLWLGYSFGVRPLVSDIQKAGEALDSYTSNTNHRVRLTGTEKKEWFASQPWDQHSQPCPGVWLNYVSAAKHKLSYRYIAGINLKVFAGEDYSLLRHSGLELKNVPSALWELTTLSWVVDYFATIGPFLEDVFYTVPGNVEYCILNRRYELTTKIYGKIVGSPPSTIADGSATNGKASYWNFSRTVLTTLPYRGLRVKSVDEVGKFALNKVLNLVSVYSNFVRG